MKERATRGQKAASGVLIVLGLLGVTLLILLGVQRLAPTPADNPMDPPVASTPETPTPPSPPMDPPVASTPETLNPEEIPSPADPALPAVGIRVGDRAPDFRLPSLDGEAFALSDFLGSVVILDFWASWCGPCRDTMPALMAFVRALAPHVILVGVSLDRSASHASDYLAAHAYEEMIALYGSYEQAASVFLRYGGSGIPYTFVIDRQGIIRYVGHPALLRRTTIEPLL